MNSKIVIVSVLSLSAFFSCNSDTKNGGFFEPVSCSIKKVTEIKKPILVSAKPVKPIVKVEDDETPAKVSSDGLLKILATNKKNKIYMGKKAIETNFDLSAQVLGFECVNEGENREYFLLTSDSFNGDREEVIQYTKAVHCKLVDSVLELIPMQTFADETQLCYDTTDVYSNCSIYDFEQNENEIFEKESAAKSSYLEYNAAEKSFLYKATFRNFLQEENEEEFVEEVGKFEYKNGAFYQVLEKQRKI
ncbi:MAG: hypothetical protein ACO3E1_09605 [Flavobacteriales bacterium]